MNRSDVKGQKMPSSARSSRAHVVQAKPFIEEEEEAENSEAESHPTSNTVGDMPSLTMSQSKNLVLGSSCGDEFF